MNKLVESIQNFEILTEANNGQKNYYVHGILMQSEIENRNGRIYQRSEFEKEIKRYNEEIIPARRGIGELEHSDSYLPSMARASHIFETPLTMNGNDVYGKARILNTVHGQTAKVFVDEGISFGLSSKGTGNVLKREGKNVVYQFYLITPADLVYFQSAPGAIANTVVESALIEMLTENDRRLQALYDCELIDTVKKNIKTATGEQVKEAIRTEFQRVIDYINKNKE